MRDYDEKAQRREQFKRKRNGKKRDNGYESKLQTKSEPKSESRRDRCIYPSRYDSSYLYEEDESA